LIASRLPIFCQSRRYRRGANNTFPSNLDFIAALPGNDAICCGQIRAFPALQITISTFAVDEGVRAHAMQVGARRREIAFEGATKRLEVAAGIVKDRLVALKALREVTEKWEIVLATQKDHRTLRSIRQHAKIEQPKLSGPGETLV
jgi:hypothetical protein